MGGKRFLRSQEVLSRSGKTLGVFMGIDREPLVATAWRTATAGWKGGLLPVCEASYSKAWKLYPVDLKILLSYS